MKMTSGKRAIDKVFKRRDRYDIPEWQRERVWNKARKQKLIDSILRGWKLPKFYFVKSSGEDYLVEDGQQRLTAIFEFFSNDLTLSTDSAKQFHAKLYGDLPPAASDAFDDFEIEYDIIEEAADEDLKEFFQRLQQGMPLNSSEKLNAVHSKLRDYCMSASQHAFLKKTIAVENTRYAIQDFAGYESLIDDLYFLFREAPGTRISTWPSSFTNINELRTDLRHDTDHGEASKVRAKKRRANKAFLSYAGEGTPQTMDPGRFPLVQGNVLSAIEGDLRGILSKEL